MKNAHEYMREEPVKGDNGDYKEVSPAGAIEFNNDPVTGKAVANKSTLYNATV